MEKTEVRMRYLYRNEWREKSVSLDEVTRWICEGKYKQQINAVRGLQLLQSASGWLRGSAAAAELPRIILPVGTILLSFRTDMGVQTLEELRHRVNLWPQTLMSFIGSSGRSLKVLIAYRLTGGTLPVDDLKVTLFQQYAYRRAADYAHNATGMRPEEVVHDGSESFCMSADEQVYLNDKVQPIEMEQPTEPLSDKTAPLMVAQQDVPLDAQVIPGYTRREMDVTNYQFIFRQMAYEKLLQFDDYLMRLSVNCRKAGIDEELAVRLTLEALDCRDREVLVRATFRTAYEKHPLGVAQPMGQALIHQCLLEDFLKRHYMFRRNRVTGEVEFQEKYRYSLMWRTLTPEARNDINNAAIREGIKAWPRDLERILHSEQTEDYDPVDEWLKALPKWDGRDRLGELAQRVSTSAPGWCDNFKVWMRAMVSQWQGGLRAMYGAQMVLMLVGAQGTRKSTFMRMLLPPEFMTYYIDRIDFTNKKEALRALSRFLLINIDEYDQVSRSQMAYLKHLIQRTDVKERKLYSTTFEQQQRYAAFCATTNSLVPLKDDSGSRRYLVAEVNGPIDTNTEGSHSIDYKQLYAQIVTEIRLGEDCAFTGERERLIQVYNANYYEAPNIISLFEDLFRLPQAGDDVLLMSPTELLSFIQKERHVQVVTQSNATLLGSFLKRHGYQKGKGDYRRCYQVALLQ